MSGFGGSGFGGSFGAPAPGFSSSTSFSNNKSGGGASSGFGGGFSSQPFLSQPQSNANSFGGSSNSTWSNNQQQQQQQQQQQSSSNPFGNPVGGSSGPAPAAFGASPNVMTGGFGSAAGTPTAGTTFSSSGFGSSQPSSGFGSSLGAGFGNSSSSGFGGNRSGGFGSSPAPAPSNAFGSAAPAPSSPFGTVSSSPFGAAPQQQAGSTSMSFGSSRNVVTSQPPAVAPAPSFGFGSSAPSGFSSGGSASNPFTSQRNIDGNMDDADEMGQGSAPAPPTSSFSSGFSSGGQGMSSKPNPNPFGGGGTATSFSSSGASFGTRGSGGQQTEKSMTDSSSSPFGGGNQAPDAARDSQGDQLLQQKMEQKKKLQEELEEKKRRLRERQRQRKQGQDSKDSQKGDTDTSESVMPPPTSLRRGNASTFGGSAAKSGDADKQSLAARNAVRFGEQAQEQRKTRDLLPADIKASAKERLSAEETSSRGRDDLENAVTLVGKCEHYCPDEELVRREQEGDIQQLEIPLPGKLHPANWTLRNTAVKRFRRSAADYKLDVPEWVRPPDVLERVCGYLEEWVMDRDRQGPDPRFPNGQIPPSLEVYLFIWDRTRMIRKDFILQNYVGTGGNCDARAVRCHERIARWHAMCEHQLSHIEDFTKMQSQQNIQELGQTMITLNQLYDDALHRSTVEVPDINGKETRMDLSNFTQGCGATNVQGNPPVDFDGTPLRNEAEGSHISSRVIGKHAVSRPGHGTAEPEMRALYILLTMNNEGGMEVLKYAAKLFKDRPAVYHSKPVQLALDIFKAKKEYNYARFFSYMRDPNTPYLFCCIMFKHVEMMRKIAFRIMSKTFGARKKDTGESIYDAYPLKRLVELLCFEDLDEARSACEHYNITVKDVQISSSSDETAEIIFWRNTEFKEPKHPEKGFAIALQPWKMTRTIERKLHGATRLAVCRGEVSGEGATLDTIPVAPVTRAVKLPVPQEMTRKSVEEAEAEAKAAAEVQEKKLAEARLLKQRELEEKAKLEREREAERQRQELEAKRKAELERIEKEKALELQRRQEEELRKLHEQEEAKRLAAEKRAKEEEARRLAELEAKRKEEEARKRAEEERRLAEERRKQELARLERIRLERMLEEQRRIEEEKRQEKLRLELKAKRRREAELRRIEQEWMEKINKARKLVLWKRWQRRVSRRLQMSSNSCSVLQQLDPAFATARPGLGSMFESDEESEKPMEPVYQPDELFMLRVCLEECLRKESAPILLCKSAVEKLVKLQRPGMLTLNSKTSATGVSKFSLLLKVAIFIPVGTDRAGSSLAELLKMWLGRRLGLGVNMLSHTMRVGSIEYETRATVGFSSAKAITDCDVALFVTSSTASDRDDVYSQMELMANSLDESIPRLALVLGDQNSSESQSIKAILAETIAGSNPLQVLTNDQLSSDSLDGALEAACLKVADLFVHESFIKVDRTSIPVLIRDLVGKSLWNRSAPTGWDEDSSEVLEFARAALSEFPPIAGSQFKENCEVWSSWPPQEFLSKGGMVEDYFGKGGHLPAGWHNTLCERSLADVLSDSMNLLKGSFHGVIDSLLLHAPEGKRQECLSLLTRNSCRRCLQVALDWYANDAVESKGMALQYIYYPRGVLDQLIEDMTPKHKDFTVPRLLTETSRNDLPPGGSNGFAEFLSAEASATSHKRRRADPSPSEYIPLAMDTPSEIGTETKKSRPSLAAELESSSSDVAASSAFTKRLENMLHGETVDLLVGDTSLSRLLRGLPNLEANPTWR
eukprot:Nitzschia sp. Nitz4//scaffold155_size52807//24534//29951//NITZ4_006799-RA/size52807-snap-gene-0.38-mRNA-1//1//CDS//3329537378//5828//frame0